MRLLGVVITDRGSKYAVSGGVVADRGQVAAFLVALKSEKKYGKATHNSWAALLPTGPLRHDDGEAGAGDLILRMLQRAGSPGQIVVVTRWYGGVPLGGDRFRHIAGCVRLFLAEAGSE